MSHHPRIPELVILERFGDDDERYALIGEAGVAGYAMTVGKSQGGWDIFTGHMRLLGSFEPYGIQGAEREEVERRAKQLAEALGQTNGPAAGNLGDLWYTAMFAANVALGTVIVRAQLEWAHSDWFDSGDAAWESAIAFLESLGQRDDTYRRVALLSSYLQKARLGAAQVISTVTGKPVSVTEEWLTANGGVLAILLIAGWIGLDVMGVKSTLLGVVIWLIGGILAVVVWRNRP